MTDRTGRDHRQPSPPRMTTSCDWCGQQDTDPIRPQDGGEW